MGDAFGGVNIGVGVNCGMGATIEPGRAIAAAPAAIAVCVVAPAKGGSGSGNWLACGGVVSNGAMGEEIGAMGVNSGAISCDADAEDAEEEDMEDMEEPIPNDEPAPAAGGEFSGPIGSTASKTYLNVLGPFRL